MENSKPPAHRRDHVEDIANSHFNDALRTAEQVVDPIEAAKTITDFTEAVKIESYRILDAIESKAGLDNLRQVLRKADKIPRRGLGPENVTYSELEKYVELREDEAEKEKSQAKAAAARALKDLLRGWKHPEKNQSLRPSHEIDANSEHGRDFGRMHEIMSTLGNKALEESAGRPEPADGEPETSNQSRERLPEELREKVAKAAKGRTLIHTALSPWENITTPSGSLITGFQDIGDLSSASLGPESPDTNAIASNWQPSNLRLADIPNGVDAALAQKLPEITYFTPLTKPREERVTTGRFKKVETKVTAAGEDSVLITNNQSEPERAILMAYSFDPNRLPYSIGDPLAREYADAVSGRPGNKMDVLVVLPESVARELQEALTENPRQVRDLVRRLATERAGITAEQWEGTVPGSATRPVQPPWDFFDKSDQYSSMNINRPFVLSSLPLGEGEKWKSPDRRTYRVLA